MNDLLQKLGPVAKSIGYLAWTMGVLFLVEPIVNGKPIDWQAPPAMAVVGAFWWLLGWGLEKRGKK